jgi:3-methylcrotonyl-CoA carboxylase alpha subunit
VAEVTVAPLGNGAYHVLDGTRARTAFAAGPADAQWVFLDGHVYVIDVAEGRKKRTDDHGALSAPMPGTVVAITVQAGQRVSQGDVLIVLEAMKMELPIKAPRDGSIRTIACRPGELVQPGVPLLELE